MEWPVVEDRGEIVVKVEVEVKVKVEVEALVRHRHILHATQHFIIIAHYSPVFSSRTAILLLDVPLKMHFIFNVQNYTYALAGFLVSTLFGVPPANPSYFSHCSIRIPFLVQYHFLRSI